MNLATPNTRDKLSSQRDSARVGTNSGSYSSTPRTARPGPIAGTHAAMQACTRAGLGVNARLVWSVLASYWNPRRPGWVAEVSLERIGGDVGVSRSTVQRAMKALEAEGLLVVHRAAEAGRPLSRYGVGLGVSLYELRAPALIREPAPARTTRQDRKPSPARELPSASNTTSTTHAPSLSSDTGGVSGLCNPRNSSSTKMTEHPPTPRTSVASERQRATPESKEPLRARARGDSPSLENDAQRASQARCARPSDTSCDAPEHEHVDDTRTADSQHGSRVDDESAPHEANAAHETVSKGSAPGAAMHTGNRPRGRRRDLETSEPHSPRENGADSAPGRGRGRGSSSDRRLQPHHVTDAEVETRRPWWPDAPNAVELACALVQAHRAWEKTGHRATLPLGASANELDEAARMRDRDWYLERSVRRARELYLARGVAPTSRDPRTYASPVTDEERARARERERSTLPAALRPELEDARDDAGAAVGFDAVRQAVKKTVHGKPLKTTRNEVTLTPVENLNDAPAFSTSNAQNRPRMPNVKTTAEVGGFEYVWNTDEHAQRERPSRERGAVDDDDS